MLSFSRTRRAALLAVSLAAGLALAACTLTPAYNGDSGQHAVALSFAEPTNPLEQIVYQSLERRFTVATSPDAPAVSVSVSTATRALAQSVTTDPQASQLLTATGTVKITKNGQPVLTATRQATATYSTSGQVLADNSAQTNAANQAAQALADTLELTILAALTPATAGQ
jgi:LPS-assembly lipoprotein